MLGLEAEFRVVGRRSVIIINAAHGPLTRAERSPLQDGRIGWEPRLGGPSHPSGPSVNIARDPALIMDTVAESADRPAHGHCCFFTGLSGAAAVSAQAACSGAAGPAEPKPHAAQRVRSIDRPVKDGYSTARARRSLGRQHIGR